LLHTREASASRWDTVEGAWLTVDTPILTLASRQRCGVVSVGFGGERKPVVDLPTLHPSSIFLPNLSTPFFLESEWRNKAKKHEALFGDENE